MIGPPARAAVFDPPGIACPADPLVVGVVKVAVGGPKGRPQRDSFLRRIAALLPSGVVGTLALRLILGARSAA